MGSHRFLLLTTFFFFFLHLFAVHSTEFEVGDGKGWAVPPSKDQQMYNQWASKNRFQIDDTVRLKYKKDSVLVVTDAEYEKCHSSHPIFFSNNGDTIFKLDHPGLFYFISGVAGHCERGQKMIIKVLEPENPSLPSNQNSSSAGKPESSGAVEMAGHCCYHSVLHVLPWVPLHIALGAVSVICLLQFSVFVPSMSPLIWVMSMELYIIKRLAYDFDVDMNMRV